MKNYIILATYIKLYTQMEEELSLKIYGVTTVGPKGQVIIPKEMRNDFHIIEWLDFEIVLVDKSAFWLSTHENILKECDKKQKIIESEGNITIWSKFQFVIPSNIRNELWISPKDSLIVIGRGTVWMWFIKNDKIEYLLWYIKELSKK